MLIKFKVSGCLLIASIFTACSGKDNNNLLVQFSLDSTVIVVKNIEPAGYHLLEGEYLKTDSLDGSLLSVLEMPGDNDSLGREVEFPGKLTLKNKQVIFTPLKMFTPGKLYLVSTMLNAKFASSTEVFQDKIKSRVTPYQVTLER